MIVEEVDLQKEVETVEIPTIFQLDNGEGPSGLHLNAYFLLTKILATGLNDRP